MQQQNQQPDQQPNQNQTSTTEQKREKNKGITIALLALAAILVVVGGILLMKTMRPVPSPQAQNEVIDISGWQTYRNDEFGFEVRYPVSWQFEEFPDPALSYGLILDSFGPQKDRLYIGVGGLNYTGIDNPEIVYQQEVFAGKTVTVQSVYQENKLIAKNIEVHGSITIYTTPDSNGSFSSIDQILSTFRFVEPSSQTQWNWELLGCGSNAPCSYKVCSVADPSNCYSCVGKYDPASRGEETPNSTTDPSTTTDFTCGLEK